MQQAESISSDNQEENRFDAFKERGDVYSFTMQGYIENADPEQFEAIKRSISNGIYTWWPGYIKAVILNSTEGVGRKVEMIARTTIGTTSKITGECIEFEDKRNILKVTSQIQGSFEGYNRWTISYNAEEKKVILKLETWNKLNQPRWLAILSQLPLFRSTFQSMLKKAHDQLMASAIRALSQTTKKES